MSPESPVAPALLGPEDPPPCTLSNADGNTRVLIVADHAGRAIPQQLDQLGVDDWVLDEHVAWDIGSPDVAHALAARWNTPLITATYSRLVIDVNRRPTDPTSCIEVSDGIAIPGNLDLSQDQRAQRQREIFFPYHRMIREQLERMAAAGHAPALISIHSCTPEFDRVVRPWHIGVLWDKDPRIARPLLERLENMPGICVGDNEPYSGRDPHDYTIDHHGEGMRIPHVAIEIRQDLIDTAEKAAHWANVLGEAMDPILADDALYRLLD